MSKKEISFEWNNTIRELGKQQRIDSTVCIHCGEPLNLRDEDAGSEKEMRKLCDKCLTSEWNEHNKPQG